MDEDEAIAQQETAPGSEVDPSPADSSADQGRFDKDAQAATIPQAQAQQDESFLAGATLDPTKLPPEILPIFKKMQGAYTKKMQEAARWREHSEMVERFQNDRDYGFQTVAQWAARNGYSIAPVGQPHQQPAQQASRPGQASQAVVESIKANLPPELQWMAESVAPAINASVQQMLEPLARQLTQQQAGVNRQVMEREWDTLAEELGNVAPGWEEHEPQMVELLDFLQGPTMKHPQFGSKHQLLYNLVTSNAAATAQVTKRMQQAATNRSRGGITTGRTT